MRLELVLGLTLRSSCSKEYIRVLTLSRDSCGILCSAPLLASKPALCVLVTQSSAYLFNLLAILAGM